MFLYGGDETSILLPVIRLYVRNGVTYSSNEVFFLKRWRNV